MKLRSRWVPRVAVDPLEPPLSCIGAICWWVSDFMEIFHFTWLICIIFFIYFVVQILIWMFPYKLVIFFRRCKFWVPFVFSFNGNSLMICAVPIFFFFFNFRSNHNTLDESSCFVFCFCKFWYVQLLPPSDFSNFALYFAFRLNLFQVFLSLPNWCLQDRTKVLLFNIRTQLRPT